MLGWSPRSGNSYDPSVLERGKPTKETANTGLPGSETNPELLGVIDWTWLANEIEKIQKLVQQGELTWEEVYLLFEKIFNTLEAKLKTTREEAIFGFRKSLDALREKIAEISTNLSREVFGQITGSKMFKQLIMKIFASIIVGVLVFSPITSASFQHTGLAVVLQGLVRPRLRGTELEFWRNSEEARTDRPSQQLRSLNGEWRLMRYFLLTHLCGISHRIWCTLSTICSDAA